MPPRALRSVRFAIAFMLLAGCWPQREYLYAHAIVGIVVDANDRPVAGARVARVLPSGAAYGIDLIYVTTTDDHGHFEFRYRGLGGEARSGTDTWVIVASDGHGQTRQEVVAPWTCVDGRTETCPGFHADVVLRLRR